MEAMPRDEGNMKPMHFDNRRHIGTVLDRLINDSKMKEFIQNLSY